MNRDEFMERLEYLLSDIPEEDKADALSYYRDYLEEAGDAADEAIKEFGSPERIAAIIRTDLQGHMEEGGEFTDRGYEDERFRDPNYQVARRYDLPEVKEKEGAGGAQEEGSSNRYQNNEAQTSGDWTSEGKPVKRNGSVWKIILLVGVLFAASPVLLGIGGGLVGIFTGALVLALGILLLLAVLTIGLLIGGAAVCVAGIITMWGKFLDGLLLSGLGLIFVAIGLVGLVASVWFYGKLIPWMFRGCVDGINRLVHRRVRTN